MPKLPARVQKAVDKADAVYTTGFEPLPRGWYIATLSDVEARNSSSGNPMWAIEWNAIQDLDGEGKPGRLFFNLMMPTSSKPPADYKPDDPKREESWSRYQELCLGRVKAFFEAHGFTTDSDTDEMVGEQAMVEVDIETQQKGSGAGKQRNVVVGFKPVDHDQVSSGHTDRDDADDEF